MSEADPFSALFQTFSAAGDAAGRTLFVNAVPGERLSALGRNSLLVQPLASDASVLAAQGWQVVSDIPHTDEFDQVIVLITKHHDETRAQMASALMRLKAGGLITVAGANDAGGKRIEKDFMALGLVPVSDSKHKSRVVRAQNTSDANLETAQAWVAQGQWQPVLEGRYISRPGLFNWNEIDKGSLLLTENLAALSGRGADFGCGYGYLSAYVLAHHDQVMHMTAYDVDARAVEACRKNTKFSDGKIECVWQDLTQLPAHRDFDFIVMNPPFHEGSATQNQLGINFIRAAAFCLKPGGQLFMVANTHLPYEDVLKSSFSNVRQLDQGKGFKIIGAVR